MKRRSYCTMLTFISLLQEGNQILLEELLERYKPLLIRASIVRDILDEDLYQEQSIVLLRCIELYDRFDCLKNFDCSLCDPKFCH
uniref:helix-turn-helix domain-containing protein n=1 Tax=Acetatifactor sp. TaxID=1872090 RepID=UPI004057B847